MYEINSVTPTSEHFNGFLANDENTIIEKRIYGGSKYVINKLNDTTIDGVSFSSYLFNGNGSISDALYYGDSFKNKMSIAYSYGNDSIEFVSAGIKIRITTNNSSIIDLSKYNGYSAILISMTGSNSMHKSNTELFIDEVNEQIVLFWYNGVDSLICGENNYGDKLKEILNTTDFNTSYIIDGSLYISNDASIDSSIFSTNDIFNNYFLYTETVPKDNKSYTKHIIASTTSSFNTNSFSNDNMLSVQNPLILADSSLYESLTNEKLQKCLMQDDCYTKKYIYGYNHSVELKDRAFDDLSSDLENCGISIKTTEGLNDYTTLSGVISVSPIDAYYMTRTDDSFDKTTSGLVQPTFNVPSMVDILSFKYSDSSINNSMESMLDGCNVVIDGVNNVGQTWISKKKKKTATIDSISIDVVDGISPVSNCWNNDIFSTYNISDVKGKVKGITAAVEKNVFLGSRGLNLKGRYNGKVSSEITISDWTNSSVNFEKGIIVLDITDSLIQKIMFMPGFMSIWNNTSASISTENKTKYIENNILSKIRINNTNRFRLFADESDKNFGISNEIKGTELSNISNELTHVNNKYYMTITGLKRCMYSAEMTIQL